MRWKSLQRVISRAAESVSRLHWDALPGLRPPASCSSPSPIRWRRFAPARSYSRGSDDRRIRRRQLRNNDWTLRRQPAHVALEINDSSATYGGRIRFAYSIDTGRRLRHAEQSARLSYLLGRPGGDSNVG